MSQILNTLLYPFVVPDSPQWKFFFDQILRVPRALDSAHLYAVQQRGPTARALEALKTLAPNGAVQRGLFTGLKFPETQSTFSTRNPMLLGCYEQELQEKLNTLIDLHDYSAVVDIGSADGFYAVGLAKVLPNAAVMAFDSEKQAQVATLIMAEVNEVQIDIRGTCESRILFDAVREVPRALILCDIEGGERGLFDIGSGATLRRHDVIIEMHDQIAYGISEHLKLVFSHTHHVEILRGKADYDAVRTAHEWLPALTRYDWATRHELITENRRNVPAEWLIAVARD